MRKTGVIVTGLVVLLVGLLAAGGAGPAFGQGGKKGSTDSTAEAKKLLGKLDPEIQTVQKSLRNARKELETVRTKLRRALLDEAFNEKGVIQKRVIDRLKDSLKKTNEAIDRVDGALKSANIGQVINKGGR
jgi:Skp family chaperone for outer membrane proteins